MAESQLSELRNMRVVLEQARLLARGLPVAAFRRWREVFGRANCWLP